MSHHGTVSVATGIREKIKPRNILEGAVWQLARSSLRAYCCPAKGQPLQESFGVFAFLALTASVALDNEPAWANYTENTDPISPVGESCELSARYRNSFPVHGETSGEMNESLCHARLDSVDRYITTGRSRAGKLVLITLGETIAGENTCRV